MKCECERNEIRSSISERSVLRDQRGIVIAFTAILTPLLILIAAFAVDLSLALGEHSKLQAAADHAARVAGMLRGQNQTASQITNGAYAVTAANGYVNGTNAVVTVNLPPTSGNFIMYPAAVEVIITETNPTLFSSILSMNTLPHRVRAVGDWDFAPCLVALGKGSTGSNIGISNGGSFTFTAGCGIYSNSQASKSSIKSSAGIIKANGFIIADQGGTADASNLQNLAGAAAGVTLNAPYFTYPDSLSAISSQLNSGVPTSGGTPSITGTPSTTCSPDNTPTSPTYGKCITGSGNNKKAAGTWLTTTTVGATTTYTVSPNYYYATFPAPPSGTTYTLSAGGIYYTNSFSLTSGATVDGTAGATLALVGSGASMSLAGGAALNINAPSAAQSSIYGGIAIISGTTNVTSTIQFTGGSGTTGTGINGIISLPSADLKVAGGSSTSTNCQTYFANSVTISGSGGIGNGCNSTISNMSAFRAKNLVE